MPKDDYASAALLERWITQYGDMLVRLAYGMLRDRTLCQDAAQDTLLKAWRGYHTFRGECTEKTYLTGILMNTCRDYLRTAWMRRIDRRFTPDTLPEPYADAAPRDRTVIEAVLSLPLPQRQAVLLRYYQQLTLPEAARALGISLSTMNRRLRRAETLLKKELEEG